MTSASRAFECTNLTKTFAGRAALSSVSLSIEAGQVRAILGENGSGKSTLVKLLSGYHRPDAGSEIRIGGRLMEHAVSDAARRAGARFVHQDLGLIDSLSVEDNLSFGPGFPTRFATIRRRVLRESVSRSLAVVGLDIDPRRRVGDLLPAEKTGVALARAMASDPESELHLLVLDEPTATLPVREVNLLLGMVRSVAQQGIGVLYISHRIDETYDVADEVTVLRDGRVVLSQSVASLSREVLVTHLLGPQPEQPRSAVSRLRDTSAKVTLRADGLVAKRISDVSLQVAKGEVLGVAGITGSGRESLCQLIFGGLERRAGTVYVNDRKIPASKPYVSIEAGMAYLPADRKRDGLFLDLTAQDNLTISNLAPYWKKFALSHNAQRRDAELLFDSFDVRPRNALRSPLRVLSGGNQQKIMFAKWLRRSPQVLLLDEPTQGVDLRARASLHGNILDSARAGAAVVVSSADLEELEVLCDRVLIFRNGRVADSLRGPQVNAGALSRAVLGNGE